jgi:cytochrome b6-f complex iron-sulfur subunit
MSERPVTRRDFLKILTQGLLGLSGLLGLGGLLRFLSYETEPPPPTEFDLGPAERYPIDTRTVISKVPALLIHDRDGFSALSLVCTHLGCTVDVKPEGFLCPCHGSKYDPKGDVVRGPAEKPLPGLRVEVRADRHVWVTTT